MIVHDVEQGSAEWFALRRGIVTASMAHQIITPAKGQLSKSADKLAYRLIAERLLNITTETVEGQEWMIRGREMEPRAVKHYEFVNEVETERAGFCTTDDGMVGASPDRFIKGRGAGLEVKCPAPHTHVQYLLEGPGEDYRPQVQCQLLVCEFDYVDFLTYHERMPARTLRTGRDEPYLALMRDVLEQFKNRLLVLTERARELGAFQAYAEARTPVEIERAHQLRADIWDNGLAP